MASTKNKILVVHKPKGFSRTYEIFNNTISYGGLIFKNWGYSTAEAASSQGSWQFSYKGFGMKIQALDSKTGETVATLVPKGATTGTLEYKNSESLQWESSNWCGTRYSWVRADGVELMRFKLKWKWKHYAEIEVMPEGECRVDYLFLLFLGVYRLKLTELAMVVVS